MKPANCVVCKTPQSSRLTDGVKHWTPVTETCGALTLPLPITTETKPTPFCPSYTRNLTYTSLNMHSSVFSMDMLMCDCFQKEVTCSTSVIKLVN